MDSIPEQELKAISHMIEPHFWGVKGRRMTGDEIMEWFAGMGRDYDDVLDRIDQAEKVRDSAHSLASEMMVKAEVERERCIHIIQTQIEAIEYGLPNAHGGNFAKKVAANALRGTIALIRSMS